MTRGFDIRCLSSFESIGKDAWDKLLRCAEERTVFQGYRWLTAWWEIFSDEDRQLLLLTAYSGDDLVAAAPLFVDGRMGMVRFVGDGHNDYANFIVDATKPESIDELLDTLFGDATSWSRALLNEVPESSRLAQSLTSRALEPRRRLKTNGLTRCPRLLIAGNPNAVSEKIEKKSVKRHCAKLARLGPVTAAHYWTKSEIAPFLDDFFEQHIARWSATSHPSLFLNEQNRAFYRALISELCPTGELVFTVLRAGERVVAYHLGLISGEDFLWYKPTFDIELAAYSPGEVLLKELLLLAERKDFQAFDFTRGGEAFKTRFSNDLRYNASFSWYRSSLEAFGVEAVRVGKAIARRVMPQPVLHRLSAVRRRLGRR